MASGTTDGERLKSFGENIYLVDSIPVPICKIAREKRCKICMEDYENFRKKLTDAENELKTLDADTNSVENPLDILGISGQEDIAVVLKNMEMYR